MRCICAFHHPPHLVPARLPPPARPADCRRARPAARDVVRAVAVAVAAGAGAGRAVRAGAARGLGAQCAAVRLCLRHGLVRAGRVVGVHQHAPLRRHAGVAGGAGDRRVLRVSGDLSGARARRRAPVRACAGRARAARLAGRVGGERVAARHGADRLPVGGQRLRAQRRRTGGVRAGDRRLRHHAAGGAGGWCDRVLDRARRGQRPPARARQRGRGAVVDRRPAAAAGRVDAAGRRADQCATGAGQCAAGPEVRRRRRAARDRHPHGAAGGAARRSGGAAGVGVPGAAERPARCGDADAARLHAQQRQRARVRPSSRAASTSTALSVCRTAGRPVRTAPAASRRCSATASGTWCLSASSFPGASAGSST